MPIKPINIALFSIDISFQIVLGKPLLQIIFMKINSFLREKKYFFYVKRKYFFYVRRNILFS